MSTDSNFNWKSDYNACNDHYPNYSKLPIIGITTNVGEKGAELAEGYWNSVEAAGAIPMLLPPTDDVQIILNSLKHIDGLILSGGGDLNPLYLDEDPIPALQDICPKRDLYELMLTRLAFDRQIPILGICRGIQVLVAALDGEIYQDIKSQVDPSVELIKHSQSLPREYASHRVNVHPNSLLSKIMKSTSLAVNSLHHQAVKTPGPHLKVTAKSNDGINEAVESNELKSIIGVQWHPECFITRGSHEMLPIFEWLVDEASSYSAARQLHKKILTLDSHCDTPMFFHEGVAFDHRNENVLVDLHKMDEGGLDATIMVAYLEQKGRSDDELRNATQKAQTILDEIKTMVEKCKGVELAESPEDLYHLKAIGKKAVMRGIENGYAFGKDVELVEHFRKQGIVYTTLCHNGDNDICDSARKSEEEHGGVSLFGEKIIAEMNRVGMIVDLSHAAKTSFYDALEISSSPVVCSHSCSWNLCQHPRNIDDEQLIALAEKGGVAQVTLYGGFLQIDNEATLLDAIEHLNHMITIAGPQSIGLGTDFDGDGGIRGCASASELINFTRQLLKRRYNKEDIKNIWGGNFLRVMQEVQESSY